MPELPLNDDAARRLRWPLRLTGLGLVFERFALAFWPVWTVVFVALAALFLGLQDIAPIEAVWLATVATVTATAYFLLRGCWRFRWPKRAEVMERLDETLQGRPLAALSDRQAIGTGDRQSEYLWQTHQQRMRERLSGVRPVWPREVLTRNDPYGFRFVALTVLAVGLLFGSVWRAESILDMTPGEPEAVVAGPSWEGWIEPPAYTGKPSLYLNELNVDSLSVPQGSLVTLRLYGEAGTLTVVQTVSEVAGAYDDATVAHEFAVQKSGNIQIEGEGGHSWQIAMLPDAPPSVTIAGSATREAAGEMALPFEAGDDYGVVAGSAVIELDLDAADRRYGLEIDPEPREAITVDLPMPFTGSRTEFNERLTADFSQHAWANLPVVVTLEVTDAMGNTGRSEVEGLAELPARRFFDPLAKAVIEQRRDLLWNRENAIRVSQMLRAVSHEPDGVFRSATDYMRLRFITRRLEAYHQAGLTDERVDEMSQALWDLALSIEEGDLSDALKRMRRAQERLSEAMRDGASPPEIAELMQELREATQDYLRQLAEQQPEDGTEFSQNENTQTMNSDQLQEMFDRLQQLMEEGRMAEAQQLLDMLSQMMENMQIARGQQGQGQQGEGQQAMQGLMDTLRQQQGLSDDSFGRLQDQYNPQGDGSQPNGQDLADHQQALRDLLEQQRQALEGLGETGEGAGEALDRAGRAMEQAEEALRGDDLAGSLDSQSDAMEALRDGVQELGRELAQQQQPGQGQQGNQLGQTTPAPELDPLGRQIGPNQRFGTNEALDDEDVYRRARDLLDEIRRRSGEQTRPGYELDYLRRLLDRF
ncbi:DUF4175 domain-containing protein [Qingshengfaniella alkalisoli]|uniref:DUF4175 domain-containing protein n=1 Tax=Qingshengfaniella alkalisoli TaxID=2599296 RepID=A0A5B8IT21_9RHOB|nr:DUF4175 domain-containing protein [Qingshengfaniella alkalisoli]QDY68593.1 DUF4175 domain-containing protein [Qingshengfaniella alkalisoli]